MIDSAQWWLYEQTSFRQLSGKYTEVEEFMGPREAHMQNERPPSPLLSPAPPPHSSRAPGSSPPATGVPTRCGDAEPDMTRQRRWNATSSCSPSCGKHGVCNQRDRRSSQNPLRLTRWEVDSGGSRCYTISWKTACPCALGFCTDLSRIDCWEAWVSTSIQATFLGKSPTLFCKGSLRIDLGMCTQVPAT